MQDTDILKHFQSLWNDLQGKDQIENYKPLLAHYTSIEVFEKIIEKKEIWFSNPLFMNDIAEIQYGMFKALALIKDSKEIEQACGTPERFNIFNKELNFFHDDFANNYLVDTYIFCLSEHDNDNVDGALSMWRGYGSNGNGIAIVFDTSKITLVESSPLIISKVSYLTPDKLAFEINRIILNFVELLFKINIPDDKLGLAAFMLFRRIKTFSLFTKHIGFQEEKEWRIVYMKELDQEGTLSSMFSYLINHRGIEPKLKLEIKPIRGTICDDISLKKIVNSIILGPSLASRISVGMIFRMLNQFGESEMIDKVRVSGIPFRAR